MGLQPRQAGSLVDLRQAAADRVLTHNLLHAQQPRVHRIAPQRRDVGVAVMPEGMDDAEKNNLYRTKAAELDPRKKTPAPEVNKLIDKDC